MQKVHIIAEAGTNHGGDINKAKKLVDIAKKSGADSVKFQIIYPEGLYLPKIYVDGKCEDNEVFSLRKKGMLTDEEYDELFKYCNEKGIFSSASVFDKRGIELLLRQNDVPYIKVASCDLNNSYLLKMAAEKNKRIIISTGMATLKEIERAVEDILSTGNKKIVLMHCVSVYPCLLENMNLSRIAILKREFNMPVGLSDHTEDNIASIIAVGMGVEWIEKHFTYDRLAEGFDHSYAMEPDTFKGFIDVVRKTEKACANRPEELIPEEMLVRKRARRSLYASREISKGDIIALDNVMIVRPEGNLLPNDLEKIVGQKVNRNIKQYQAIAWDDIDII